MKVNTFKETEKILKRWYLQAKSRGRNKRQQTLTKMPIGTLLLLKENKTSWTQNAYCYRHKWDYQKTHSRYS